MAKNPRVPLSVSTSVKRPAIPAIKGTEEPYRQILNAMKSNIEINNGLIGNVTIDAAGLKDDILAAVRAILVDYQPITPDPTPGVVPSHTHAHSDLTGLSSDNHLHYHTNARGDDRYGEIYDCDRWGGLEAAISALGSTTATIKITTIQRLSANTTVPSNLNLLVETEGAYVTSDSETVRELTVNGRIFAPRLHWLDSTLCLLKLSSTSLQRFTYPEWWGIDGTNDHIEIQKAITCAETGVSGYGPGVAVILDTKVYNVAATLYIKTEGVGLVGAEASNWKLQAMLYRTTDYGSTVEIQPDTPASNLIHFNYVQGITMWHNETVSVPTGGYHIYMRSANDTLIDRCYLIGGYHGIGWLGGTGTQIKDTIIRQLNTDSADSLGYGIHCVPGVHAYGYKCIGTITNVHLIGNKDAEPGYSIGLYITCADGLYVENFSVFYVKSADVYIHPTGSNHCGVIRFTGCYFDQCGDSGHTTGYNVFLDGSSSGHYGYIHFTDCSFNGGDTTRGLDGFHVASSCQADNVALNGCRIFLMGNHGIYNASTTMRGFSVRNCHISGNDVRGLGAAGIYMTDGTSEFALQNNTIGDSIEGGHNNSIVCGTNVGSGVTDCIISGNECRNNTTDEPEIYEGSGGGVTYFGENKLEFPGDIILDSGKSVQTPEVRAIDGNGLQLNDDSGTTGFKVLDGGYVRTGDDKFLGINIDPLYPFHLLDDWNMAADDFTSGAYFDIRPSGTHTQPMTRYGVVFDCNSSENQGSYSTDIHAVRIWMNTTGTVDESSALTIKSSGTATTQYGFQTEGEDYNYIDSKLGIQVTTPTELFEVDTDSDISGIIGKAHIGYVGLNDYAGFSHVDQNGSSTYALAQNALADTFINVASGRTMYFRVNNGTIMSMNATGLLMGNGLYFMGDEVRARDTSGLTLADDSGTLGMFIEDGGNVAVGHSSPDTYLHVEFSDSSAAALTDGIHKEYFGITGTLSSALAQYGLKSDVVSAVVGDQTTNKHTLRGHVIQTSIAASGNTYSLENLRATAYHGHTTNMHDLTGIVGIGQHASTGTVTDVYGVYGYAYLSGVGTITNAYGGRFDVWNVPTGGAIGTAYGVASKIWENTGATITTGYLFHGEFTGGAPSTAWGIYLTGATQNYLSGTLGIGTAPVSGSVLTLNMSTANLEFIDSGTSGGTEDAWVQIEVGGTTIYLRGFTSK